MEVEGLGTIRSKRIVIATGALAVAPPIPGLKEAGYLDHHTVFDAEHLPPRIAVLGGGPIGLEFAQVFARLGAKVDVVEMLPRLLPKEDADIAEALQGLLKAEGITFHMAARADAVESSDAGKTVVLDDGRRLEVDELFVATGRRPALEGLNLEAGGIEVVNGAVQVNAGLRTSNPNVWAAGDVTGGLQFTHVADHMAKTVLRNSLAPGSSKISYDHVPWVTYTDPEVAHVGLGQEEAEARGGTTYSYEFSDLDRAIVDGTTKGLVKITADRKGRILGATILSSHAGELIMPVVLARKHGLTLADISGTIFPYPTMMEGVKRTADAYQRTRLEGRSGTILRKVISWIK